jgi:hypothetical protein
MNSRDIAIGLVERFEEYVHGPVRYNAKECATICVDILIEANIFPDNLLWLEVKNKIKEI